MLETLLAMNPATVTTFLMAGIVLNLTPGADVAFASACGVSGGWRAGVAAAVGISSGSVLHILLAAVGLSAAVLAVPYAYDIIRYLGAAYLAYLAWRSWNATGPEHQPDGASQMAHAIRRGFVTNVMNPKVALFIMALLPQFTDPAIGPVWHQIVALGAIFITTGLIITSAYGAAAGVFGAALGRARGGLSKLSALVFGALAVKIVLE